MVEGEDLAPPPSPEDVALGAAAHTKCIHLQSGHLLNTHITGSSPYSHSGFALLARKLHILDHLGKPQESSWYNSQTTSSAPLEGGVGLKLARNL